MARRNTMKPIKRTHEGALARNIDSEMELRRSVMACLLWEKQFYEDGISIADRIASLIPCVHPENVAIMAREARNQMKLRHVPLLIAREMSRYTTHKPYVRKLLYDVIQRPDEMTELLALYWQEHQQPISAQVKKGLAEAFTKFDGYQLSKYNRKRLVNLRDVLFLCHPKPKDKIQAEAWKKLADGRLEAADTWEVNLSRGLNKKETWERLLSEKRLGALALLRNLRNFQQVGVGEKLVLNGIKQMNAEKILPFRFISAAQYAPKWESEIEKAMFRCIRHQEKLAGHTVLLIDVSGSMDAPVSKKSNISRLDAACGVAMLLREICYKIDVYSFSFHLKAIPARKGFALRDAIVNSQTHGGTYLGTAVQSIYGSGRIAIDKGYGQTGCSYMSGQNARPDRLIVITDEQSHDKVPDPKGLAYMINVAAYQNGVGYGPWVHIDGWSEAVINYIQFYENRFKPIIC